MLTRMEYFLHKTFIPPVLLPVCKGPWFLWLLYHLAGDVPHELPGECHDCGSAISLAGSAAKAGING